jgi:hypothetical protein
MDVNGVTHDVVTEIIGFSVRVATSYSSSSHKDTETAWVMVSPVVLAREIALGVNRATELAAPNDERVIEQSALFEFGQKSAGGLVGVVALAFDA